MTLQPHELFKEGTKDKPNYITLNILTDLFDAGYKEVYQISNKKMPYLFKQDEQGEHWLLLKSNGEGLLKILYSDYIPNHKSVKLSEK